MTKRWLGLGLAVCCAASTAAAAMPSVFRGVVVADSPLGVRVVSVEEQSQAALADLRPEDIIIRVNEQDVRSIDEFAVLSGQLRGKTASVPVVVFRNGVPRELRVHAYSYPVLRAWDITFVPEHDIRFAEPPTGLAYWIRLGLGFEEAGKPEEALNAYLNGLHNVPGDVATALRASGLFSRVSERRLAEGKTAEGVAALRQSGLITQKLFDHPLTDEQLNIIRLQLRSTLDSLKRLTANSH